MTEPAPTSSAPSESKDYWDIVLQQMRKRRGARLALVLLALLYATAIYAPFLAGDRPLLIEATDAAGFRKAARELTPISGNLRDLAAGGPAAFAEQHPDQDFEARLDGELSALRQRLRALADQLAEEDRGLLDELRAEAERTAAASQAERADEASAAGERLFELARRVRKELDPGETVALVANLRSPALEAIGHAELYFMLLWLFVLGWPLWNPLVNRLLLKGEREAIRRARRPKALCAVLLPCLPLLFWTSGEDPNTTSPWKAGLTKGDIVASRVVMPPIAFGLAEIHDAEYLRPPTWHRDSELDENGRYVHRAVTTTIEGFEVPARPVEVRHGEPERNDPARHPLGTDTLGRDLLARMIWGGRVSLSVGLVSTVFLTIIGVLLGALAGYHRGWVDTLISRAIEIFQCFPVFFLILIIVAFTGPDILNIMIVLGVTRWPGVARLVRGEFIRLRDQEFVLASEALGVPGMRTIFRHILPNALGPVLVAATFSVASGILTESALSYLGFGVQLPIPSWGSLLIESRSPNHWWIQIFPGLFIFLTVVLYNVFGEGVRDALDPRLKG